MAHSREEQLSSFGRLLDILDILRVQCPWDAKQTNQTLRPNTIEEVYELSSALLEENRTEIKKELGDLLLHIIFYAKIGDESGGFDIKDVCDTLVEKLIYRHPHIFGETKVEDAREVEQNWEALKLKEKGGNKTVLAGVPKSLPSLVKAFRIQEKVANVGFDWEKPADVWDKVKEELQEFEVELKESSAPSIERKEEELGDLLFSIINASRLYGLNPDTALEKTNVKFTQRFTLMETLISKKGLTLKEMSLEELEEYYQRAKRMLQS